MCEGEVARQAPLQSAARGQRRKGVFALVGVASLIVAAGAMAGFHSIADKSGGDVHVVQLHTAAPSFDPSDLRNRKARIVSSALRGKPVVVNFWASWCVPCRREMTAFERAHQKFGDAVTFVGVATNDGDSDALSFARELGITYLLAYDSNGATAVRFDVVGLPSTTFIDSRGIARERRLGAMTEAELERSITKLLR